MKIDQLEQLAIEEPFGRGSTSRFRLAGGTLWYKDTAGYCSPLLSHSNTFIANWGKLTHWDLKISSRSYNQMDSLHSRVLRGWLQALSGSTDEQADTLPAVSIWFNFPSREVYSVKKPTAAATKMLLRGRHPENNTDRVAWSLPPGGSHPDFKSTPTPPRKPGSGGDYKRKEGEEHLNPYKDLFLSSFEDAVSSLAYGAVRRENTLRDLTQTLSQLKTSLDSSASNMVEELREGADNNYAPLTLGVAGLAESHLHELVRKMKHFKSLSNQCQVAADIFADLVAAPDSIIANVNTPSDGCWGQHWPNKIASLEDIEGSHEYADYPLGIVASLSRHNSCLRICASPSPHTRTSDCGRGVSDEDQSLPTIQFTEHNIRGFSYYWVRRYKEFYEDILGKVDCNLPNLFGKAPEDWDYLELAAPIFAAE